MWNVRVADGSSVRSMQRKGDPDLPLSEFKARCYQNVSVEMPEPRGEARACSAVAGPPLYPSAVVYLAIEERSTNDCLEPPKRGVFCSAANIPARSMHVSVGLKSSRHAALCSNEVLPHGALVIALH